jgi:hypothetical protein
MSDDHWVEQALAIGLILAIVALAVLNVIFQ